MARQGQRHGRWFDLLATVLIGLVVTGAALVPAMTASSGGTTTLRGDVTLDGRRLAFFPVGFWASGDGADGGVLTSTRTDANGVFTLDVPSTRDGYAFAGTAPDSSRALLRFDGQSVVRGTIGAKVASPVASPLYQGWDPASARGIAGGADRIRFRLQRAGRVGGTLPIPARQVRAVQVRRLDGSVVETPRPDARGRWVSGDLVPGRYAVALVPVAPLLPVAVQADIASAATARAALPAPQSGATVDGLVRTASGGSVQGVPVLLEQGGEVLAATTADRSGAYRFTAVAAGQYTVEVGRFAEVGSARPSPAEVEVPIPGRSPSPDPTASSPAPTSSPSAEAQAVLPFERTADAVLPADTEVIVPDGLGQVSVVSDAPTAARLSGTVRGADGEPVQVVVEEAGTGRVLRVADADDAGRWSVGGLVPGAQLTVWAVTRPSDPTQARMGRADGVAQRTPAGVDVVIDRGAAALQGTVPGADGGTVVVGDRNLLQGTSQVDASGAYAVQALVPGLYPAVVQSPGRLSSAPVTVRVQQDGGPQDLQRGPRSASFKGWFISGGDGAPLVAGIAVSGDGSTVRFARAEQGRVLVDGLRPGTYAYDAGSFSGTVPAIDGPWWFDAPQGTFALNDGQVTNVGPIVLHVRAR